MTTDSIGDLIIQIKNGGRAKKETISVPFSTVKSAIVDKLSEKGYVKALSPKKTTTKKGLRSIEIGILYYENGKPRISDVKRMSKPSRRVYKGYGEIHSIKQGFGSTIISTPKGILSDDEAREQKVGGEILFKIW
jgi:small subunit ribosomal protein S8